jgi:lauroyl/myristoyl acyltransferase
MLALYKFHKFVFRYLLPEQVRYPLVRLIARGVVRFNRPRRTVILGNLVPLVGPERAGALAPALLGNFLMTAVDFFCPRRNIAQSTPIENWSAVEKAYRRSKKVMLVTAHLGNWELGIACLVEKGYSVAGVYAPYRGDEIVSWILAHRNPDVEWIAATRGAAEACINALERGRLLGMVGDIPFGEKGRRVRVNGVNTHLPLGPWAIAARSGATVFPTFIIRESPGHYRMIIHEGLVPGEGSFRQQIERMQDAYGVHLERYLNTYPAQWGVLQPFWDPK